MYRERLRSRSADQILGLCWNGSYWCSVTVELGSVFTLWIHEGFPKPSLADLKSKFGVLKVFHGRGGSWKKKSKVEFWAAPGGFDQHCKSPLKDSTPEVTLVCGSGNSCKFAWLQRKKILKKQTPSSTGSQFTYWNLWSPCVLCTFLSLTLVSCRLFNFFISFVLSLGLGFRGYFFFVSFGWLFFFFFLFFVFFVAQTWHFLSSTWSFVLRGGDVPTVPHVSLEQRTGWEETLLKENCFTPGCRKVVGTL